MPDPPLERNGSKAGSQAKRVPVGWPIPRGDYRFSIHGAVKMLNS